MHNDKQTKLDFQAMIKTVWSIYSKELTAGVLDVYWHSLAQYDLEEVRKALNLHVQNPDTGQFCPKPADLVKILSGSNSSRAMIAWSKIEQALRLVGPWKTIVFDDQLIHAVLADMGGWITLNTVTAKELPFRAAEFEKRYVGYAARGELPKYPRTLIGMAELANSRNNQRVEPPLLLGDPGKAQLVYDRGDEAPTQIKQMKTMKMGALPYDVKTQDK